MKVICEKIDYVTLSKTVNSLLAKAKEILETLSALRQDMELDSYTGSNLKEIDVLIAKVTDIVDEVDALWYTLHYDTKVSDPEHDEILNELIKKANTLKDLNKQYKELVGRVM